MSDKFTINGADCLIYKFNPKVILNQELHIGGTSIPVKIELDFTGIETSQHEDLLRMAYQIYAKDTVIHGK